MPQTNEQFRDVPAGAMVMRSAPIDFKFEANRPVGAPVAIEILARTPEPVEHWFWGAIVHDLAGMTSKPSIPLDYQHDPGEVLGFADGINPDQGAGLKLSGKLIPFEPTDRASEVIAKKSAGVPYEASIDWSDKAVIEEVPTGMTTNVNGRTFAGPLCVVRKWTLRGCAVCLQGVDSGTSIATRFANDAAKIKVQTFSETPTMAETNPANPANPTTPPANAPPKPADIPAVDAPAGSDTPAATPNPAAQSFVKAFGDFGARAFVDGKTFEATAAEYIGNLSAAHSNELATLRTQWKVEKDQHAATLAAKDATIADLNKRLTAAGASVGAPEPTATPPAETPAEGGAPAAREYEKTERYQKLAKTFGVDRARRICGVNTKAIDGAPVRT